MRRGSQLRRTWNYRGRDTEVWAEVLFLVDPLQEDNVEIVSSLCFPLASGFGLPTSLFIDATSKQGLFLSWPIKDPDKFHRISLILPPKLAESILSYRKVPVVRIISLSINFPR